MFRTTNPIQTPKTFRIRWVEVAATTAVCALTFSLVTVGLHLGSPTSPVEATTPQCATEDDTDCFWDADSQGNGTGESFYTDAKGNTYYLPASDKCERNLKAWTRDAQQMIEDMDSRWASSAPYSDSVRADNIDPMTSRLDYVISEVCK